jgi:hypothetical protein
MKDEPDPVRPYPQGGGGDTQLLGYGFAVVNFRLPFFLVVAQNDVAVLRSELLDALLQAKMFLLDVFGEFDGRGQRCRSFF